MDPLFNCMLTVFAEGTATTYTGDVGSATYDTFYYGLLDSSTSPFEGYLDEIRVSNSARYTSAFTPTTTQFVGDTNTVFLTHGEVFPIVDDIGPVLNASVTAEEIRNLLDVDQAGAGGIALTALSVGAEGSAAGDGAIAYNNTNGVFTFTPADLSSYLTSYTETNDLSTAVTWANVPDVNITTSSVVQHQGNLSITESQISDLGHTTALPFSAITSTPTTLSGYGITDAQASLVSATNIKTVNGSSLLGSGDLTVAGGSASNSFSTIATTSGTNVVADSSTDTLTLTAGSGISITGDAGTDTITVAATGGGASTGNITISGFNIDSDDSATTIDIGSGWGNAFTGLETGNLSTGFIQPQTMLELRLWTTMLHYQLVRVMKQPHY